MEQVLRTACVGHYFDIISVPCVMCLTCFNDTSGEIRTQVSAHMKHFKRKSKRAEKSGREHMHRIKTLDAKSDARRNPNASARTQEDLQKKDQTPGEIRTQVNAHEQKEHQKPKEIRTQVNAYKKNVKRKTKRPETSERKCMHIG